MLFKLRLSFKSGQLKFLFCQKIGAIFGPVFCPKFGHFCSKIKFLDIFFETAHQICLKLGQNLGAIALNHPMAVLCLGKFLFWRFCPFLGQNTLLVIGLSALAVEAYGFTLVRPLVRPFLRPSVRPSVTAYLENRASDFDDFLHKATS